MADLTPLFRILKVDGTEAGEAPTSRIEGDVAAGKVGLIAFSYKDSAGNVVLPQLTAAGAIVVDTSGAAGACISGQAQAIAGSTVSFQDVITLVLALTKNYSGLEFSTSCFRNTLWEIVRIDDVGGTPVEVKVWTGITGPGQFTVCCNLDCGNFDTIGNTGVQNLVLRGKNLNNESDLHGYLAIKEA